VTIALLLIGSNLLIDRPDDAGAGSEPETAQSGLVSSESSSLLVANLPAEVQELRLRRAALQLQRAEARETKARARRRQLAEFRELPGTVSREILEAIASCESGGDPKIVSAGGLYHGKYQFSPDTWEGVGGKGLPSEAPEAEQDYRAALLYERSGPGQWPVCGY